ncbi:hypothetical protein TARUN_7344 [Trichoderma arundinaceum]|uniref:Uncharacterized protein n=1 Tax=Trichoderma arundinaceum TaxID=490622 RepID=A0A395NG62_TRIAR|nr:hypothetical protein TARUN_7344 [Trichoderma arundinaceum]
MRADPVVAVLAACLPVGLCDTSDPAPQCAINCASSIRSDKASLDLKVICGDKLMTNSLFQCLISSCSHDVYGPAVAHVVMACSNLGMNIGPLHPVEVQHVNLEKPQYLPTPSLPAAYTAPSDPPRKDVGHLTLAFDISIDLKCNSGPDGLVTMSLPPPVPPTSSALPSPTPDPGNGDGEGENENSYGDGTTATSSSPPEQTQATADPGATSSCPPDSVPSAAQDPSSEQVPSHSTNAGDQGGPSVTASPSSTSPDGGDPESPVSESPCSTVSGDTGGLDPQDPNQSGSSPSSTSEASHLPNDGGKPEASATSDAASPIAVTPAPAPASSTCSTIDDVEMSVDPIPDPRLSQTTEPTTAAQPSPVPSPPSPPATDSSTEQAPISTIHPAPPPSPPSYEGAHESSVTPPEYASSGPSEQSLSGSSATRTSLPESSTEPSPPEDHSSVAEAPSHLQVSMTASRTNAAVVGTTDGLHTGKTVEPSETTLWPTATLNRTSCATSSTRGGGLPTTTCEPDGKRTLTTAHLPRSDSPTIISGVEDAPSIEDPRHKGPLGSVMVKIIRPGKASAETMLMTLSEKTPSATTVVKDLSNEGEHASGAHLSMGSGSSTQPKFATSFSRPHDAGMVTSIAKVALVNGDSALAPQNCMVITLIALASGMLMT